MSKSLSLPNFDSSSNLRKIQLYLELSFKLIGYNSPHRPKEKVLECLKHLPATCGDLSTIYVQFTNLLAEKDLLHQNSISNYGKYSKTEYFYKKFWELPFNQGVVDVFIHDSQNLTQMHPIHFAACQGKTGLVSKLLRADCCTINTQDGKGNGALHYAVSKANINLLEFLLSPINGQKSGIDVSLQNIDGNTPLHLATHRFSLEVTRLLLNHDADPNVTNNDELTPVHLAAIKMNGKQVRELMAFGGEFLTFINGKFSIYWFEEHHGECMKFLYKQLQFIVEGENIESGEKLMFHSIDKNHYPMLKAFLDGNNITYTDSEFARTLLKQKDSRGNSMLIKAISKMPFDIETLKYNSSIVKLLVDNGADIDQFANGHTALHVAAGMGAFSLVKYLVHHHADLQLLDQNNHTAREIADINGFSQIASFLAKYEDAQIVGDCNGIDAESS